MYYNILYYDMVITSIYRSYLYDSGKSPFLHFQKIQPRCETKEPWQPREIQASEAGISGRYPVRCSLLRLVMDETSGILDVDIVYEIIGISRKS